MSTLPAVHDESHSSRFPGRVGLIIAVVIAVVAGAWYFTRKRGAAATEFITGKVERGTIRKVVNATGTVQSVLTVQVGSQASGTISALYADYNSVVKKGQVIAQLDPAVSKAQVDQARANLQQAKAALQQARAAVANSRAGVSDAQARAQSLARHHRQLVFGRARLPNLCAWSREGCGCRRWGRRWHWWPS